MFYRRFGERDFRTVSQGGRYMYKMAVGSSDGINVDLKFGEVEKFLIYEADELGFVLKEERIVSEDKPDGSSRDSENTGGDGSGCGEDECGRSGCGAGSGCGGGGGGCTGPADVISKVEMISDCRCVVCSKVGFQAQKQFEKKAISVFDVECEVKEALEKITSYYARFK